jgi:hypothetical protein
LDGRKSSSDRFLKNGALRRRHYQPNESFEDIGSGIIQKTRAGSCWGNALEFQDDQRFIELGYFVSINLQ